MLHIWALLFLEGIMDIDTDTRLCNDVLSIVMQFSDWKTRCTLACVNRGLRYLHQTLELPIVTLHSEISEDNHEIQVAIEKAKCLEIDSLWNSNVGRLSMMHLLSPMQMKTAQTKVWTAYKCERLDISDSLEK